MYFSKGYFTCPTIRVCDRVHSPIAHVFVSFYRNLCRPAEKLAEKPAVGSEMFHMSVNRDVYGVDSVARSSSLDFSKYASLKRVFTSNKKLVKFDRMNLSRLLNMLVMNMNVVAAISTASRRR